MAIERVAGERAPVVVAYDGVDGHVRWRSRVRPASYCDGLALDRAGNVLLECSVEDEERNTATVVALAGETGTERWRRGIRAQPGFDSYAFGYVAGRPVAVDSAGNAFVFATLEAPGYTSSAVMAKLDGADGDEQWRFAVPGTAAGSFAVDETGDVVFFAVANRSSDVVIVKVAGATGTERWRASPPRSMSTFGIAVARDGTIALAGRLPAPDFDERWDFGIVALDGATGLLRWQSRVVESPVAGGQADLAAFVGGDVVAAGLTRFTRERESDAAFTVARFDGVTGAERWRRTIDGSDPIVVGLGDHASAMVVDGAGDLLVGGVLRNARTCQDAAVVKVDGASGAVRWKRTFDGTVVARKCVDVCYEFGSCSDESPQVVDKDWLADVAPQAGGVVVDMDLVQRVSPYRPSDRRLVVMSELLAAQAITVESGTRDLVDVRSRDRRVLAPAPSDVDAPRDVGAVLRLVRPDDGRAVELALPAEGWRPSRVAGGWRWAFTSSRGPCSRASVTTGGGVRVRCAGKALGLPLGSPGPTRMGADLRFGAGARWCLAFEGTVADTPGGGQRFTVGPADAPARCE